MDAAAGAGGRFVFTHQAAALCCTKWRYGRHLESRAKSCTSPFLAVACII